MGTPPSPATPPPVSSSLYSRVPPPPPPPTPAAAAAASAPLRASFVSEILSVPLLPSRLGVDGVDLLLKDRTGAFTDCLRDFRVELATAAAEAAAARSTATSFTAAAAAADGKGGAKGTRTRGGGGAADAKKAGLEKSGRKPAADRGSVGCRRSWGSASSQRSSGTGSAAAGGGWGAFHLPPPPVACCSTESFLLGNIVALGTKLSVAGGRASGGGSGARAGVAAQEKTGRRDQREFMRAVTSLLELRVRHLADGGYKSGWDIGSSLGRWERVLGSFCRCLLTVDGRVGGGTVF